MSAGAGAGKTLAGINLISGIGTGISQFAQGRAEAKQAELNASISETQGTLVEESQKLTEFKKRKAIRELTGEQVALFAKSGVTFTGSPVDVIQEDIADAELDIAIDRINARIGLRAIKSQADIERRQARDIRTAATLRGSKTLLTSAATFGSKFVVPKKKKIGD